MKGVAL
jgi:hypothetical protein